MGIFCRRYNIQVDPKTVQEIEVKASNILKTKKIIKNHLSIWILSLDLRLTETEQVKKLGAQQFECGFEGKFRLMLDFCFIYSRQKVVERHTQDDIIWKHI